MKALNIDVYFRQIAVLGCSKEWQWGIAEQADMNIHLTITVWERSLCKSSRMEEWSSLNDSMPNNCDAIISNDYES